MWKRDFLACLLLITVLLVLSTAGCNFFSSSDQPPPSQGELSAAQRDVEETKRARDAAAAKVERARQRYEALKQTADNLSQQSVRSKKASDVNDPRLDDPALSPNTAPARKQAKDALAELNAAIEDKEKAEQASGEAQDKFEKSRARQQQAANENPKSGETNTPLLLYVLGPLLILLSVGVLAFLFWRKIDAIEDRAGRTLGRMLERQEELSQSFGVLSNSVGKLREEVLAVQHSVNQLRLSTDQSPESTSAEPDQRESVVIADEIETIAPDFPITVAEYFDKPRPYLTAARPDRLKNMLVKDPDGQLMLVQGTGDYEGRLLAIPRTPRFKTVQDYNNHFEKYYACYKPSSGEVFIDTPAIVTQGDGGWELDSKGLLEIR